MNERQSLMDALDDALENETFNKAVMVRKAENVCCFGLGTYFKEAFASKHIKEKWHVNLLSDNDPGKWGKSFLGIPCVSPKELMQYENLVVIILMGDPRPVQQQLNQMGIRHVTHVDLSIDDELGFTKDREEFAGTRSRYLEAYDLFEDEDSRKVYLNAVINRIAPSRSRMSWDELYSKGEYFNIPFMNDNSGGVFIDCGAWTGDTVKEFSDSVGGNYRRIHAFELDRENFLALQRNTAGMHDVVLHHAGVGEENGRVAYGKGEGDNEPSSGISIMKAGTGEVQYADIVRLDDALAGEDVTFIKMDIEGSETAALRGARELLRLQKPQLAICVYHRTSDFWEVPLLVREANPGYNLYLRHHYNRNAWGTVLYAV
ncbi:MAG: FkbM family methyltransferase [Selenomonadaceae bacterium]|nr:FkbM family methyltransferase [Selenomonadaceae bacterium]